jgi:hypothetical protein
MTFPSLPGQQELVARETVAELRAGRPVQLFVTDFPRIELNHSVLAFDYRASGPGQGPAPLCGVVVPRFRAFRQYYSPLF